MIQISLSSPNIVEIGGIHVNNAVMASIVTTILLTVVVFIARSKFKLVPGRLQVALEAIVLLFEEQLIGVFRSKEKARKYLGFFVTLFLFILLANLFSVLPFFSQILVGQNYLFKGSTTDFSQTIALGLVTIGGAHLIAFAMHPLRHLNNFIALGPLFKARSVGQVMNALLEIFLGLLNIIGEFAKFASISARLFGNNFAGGMIIAVVASLSIYTAYVVPIPFIVLNIFSSFVQAYVFTMLGLNFMAATIKSVEKEGESVPIVRDEMMALKTAHN